MDNLEQYYQWRDAGIIRRVRFKLRYSARANDPALIRALVAACAPFNVYQEQMDVWLDTLREQQARIREPLNPFASSSDLLKQIVFSALDVNIAFGEGRIASRLEQTEQLCLSMINSWPDEPVDVEESASCLSFVRCWPF